MKRRFRGLSVPRMAIVSMALGAAQTAWSGGDFTEFDEFEPFVEINASDGDAGWHMLLDGEAWRRAVIFDADGDRILKAVAISSGAVQGFTEFFVESAEPPCWFDAEDPDADEDEVVSLAEFLARFEEGTYKARGRTIEDDRIKATGDFTHNIPAAPETEVEIEWDGDEVEVEISWKGGEDLGQCLFPKDLLETDPKDVGVVRWEIVVEPDEDQLDEINAKRENEIADGVFSVQVPAHVDEITISEEWLEAYVGVGVTTFKYEVGAKEESGNQTFTEDEFDIYEDAED